MSAKKTGKIEENSYRLEDQVGHLLRRAHQRATAIFLERLNDADVTPTQFAALAKLADEGELSQNHLGRLTAMDPATIQGVTRRLKARGLIAGRADPKDGRRTLLRLSATGVRLAERVIPNGFEVSEGILEPLSGAERKQFLRLLKRLT
ncbi:MAG: MarR family winged helix-turn-helix transcriptional regulator [Alphaproteobacteria bacterium]|mgnify:FL=1|nr:MarR family winged helix-turn-helix transcriptional regulator [Alphaproteobacteria bacterium]MDP6588134.1 MarR family winged helix-turn-helix transcriptional regulator [Alphaproteobacteria bacterium]MDP6816545.1 MarR family winged helix-turn-helix transcriptional regulator [Alphaproteobacteria bacterium]